MRALIIAAGEGSRWGSHLGVPKHLATIGGESILARIVRLFAPHAEVTVVGPRDDRYRIAGASLYSPRIDDRNYGADKFLNSRHLWNRDGRTLVVYGDVYFSEEAVHTIVDWPHRDWYLFARFGPSRVYGGARGECFAQSLWPSNIPDHLTALRRVVKARRERFIHEAGGWQHYRAVEGLFLDEHARGPRLVEIDDVTDDLDYPDDHQRISAAVEAGS